MGEYADKAKDTVPEEHECDQHDRAVGSRNCIICRLPIPSKASEQHHICDDCFWTLANRRMLRGDCDH